MKQQIQSCQFDGRNYGIDIMKNRKTNPQKEVKLRFHDYGLLFK